MKEENKTGKELIEKLDDSQNELSLPDSKPPSGRKKNEIKFSEDKEEIEDIEFTPPEEEDDEDDEEQPEQSKYVTPIAFPSRLDMQKLLQRVQKIKKNEPRKFIDLSQNQESVIDVGETIETPKGRSGLDMLDINLIPNELPVLLKYGQNIQQLKDSISKRAIKVADEMKKPIITEYLQTTTDTLWNELCEFYDYSEIDEFDQHFQNFQKMIKNVLKTNESTVQWVFLDDDVKNTFIEYCLITIETKKEEEADLAASSLFYIANGVHKECPSNKQQLKMIRIYTQLLYENNCITLLLKMFKKYITQILLGKTKDTKRLRLYCNILYTILCSITKNSTKVNQDISSYLLNDDENFVYYLVQLLKDSTVTKVNNYVPHKKIILLLWKCLLTLLGGKENFILYLYLKHHILHLKIL